MEVFVTIHNAGTKIKTDVNTNNSLMKVYVIKYLFGIQVIVNIVLFLILFTIVIKELIVKEIFLRQQLLDTMYCTYKWDKSKEQTLKIKNIIFLTT